MCKDHKGGRTQHLEEKIRSLKRAGSRQESAHRRFAWQVRKFSQQMTDPWPTLHVPSLLSFKNYHAFSSFPSSLLLRDILAQKILGRDFLTCRACPSLMSHCCGGHRNTAVWRPATEMSEEALHRNCSWDRMDGAGFRTFYREKDGKVILGTFYLKSWSTYSLRPCMFCHNSSSISTLQTHWGGSLATQTNKICSNVSHGRELNLTNVYWTFTCPCARRLSKRHRLCVAFFCWPHWILLLQFCCPSHLCALAAGE